MRSHALFLAGFIVLLAGLPVDQAHALDPTSAQSYCNAVKQAAANAQKNYLSLRTPTEDPQQVFDDSVQSCLANLANLSIPTISPWGQVLDTLLKKMAQELAAQVCQAARSKVQSIVSDAQQTVNNATNGVTDLGIEDGLGGQISAGNLGVGRTTVPIGVTGSSGVGRFMTTPPASGPTH